MEGNNVLLIKAVSHNVTLSHYIGNRASLAEVNLKNSFLKTQVFSLYIAGSFTYLPPLLNDWIGCILILFHSTIHTSVNYKYNKEKTH